MSKSPLQVCHPVLLILTQKNFHIRSWPFLFLTLTVLVQCVISMHWPFNQSPYLYSIKLHLTVNTAPRIAILKYRINFFDYQLWWFPIVHRIRLKPDWIPSSWILKAWVPRLPSHSHQLPGPSMDITIQFYFSEHNF